MIGLAERAETVVRLAAEAPWTEERIALEFERRHSERFRYDHDSGSWHEWVGSHWRGEGTGLVLDLIRSLVVEVGQAKLQKNSAIAGAEKITRAARCHACRQSLWDTDDWLLGTPGGTVDLHSGDLRDARPEEHITRITACAPGAAPPTRWLAFLDETCRGDAELIAFLARLVGYALTGSTREHALAFVYGSGGNGKSVWINTIAGVLGQYAAQAPMEALTAGRNGPGHPTDLAGLRGARLVSASETEEGRPWAEARIKQITGGDPITARFMRQDFFTYAPKFKLLIIGNHKPVLGNVDDALRRRFLVIPFIHKPEVIDRELETKLRDEWPGILAWAIAGCLDWQSKGLAPPSVVRAATSEYFTDQDLFGTWIGECTIPGTMHSDTHAALYRSWSGFAEANGEKPGSSKAFTAALRARGYATGLVGGRRMFKGLMTKGAEAPEHWQD